MLVLWPEKRYYRAKVEWFEKHLRQPDPDGRPVVLTLIGSRVMIPRKLAVFGLAFTLGLSATHVAAAPTLDALKAEAEIRKLEAKSRLEVDRPGVAFYEMEQKVTTAYGTAMSEGADAFQSADQFVNRYAGLFGVEAETIVAKSLEMGGPTFVPLMYDKATDSYKFTLVTYEQQRDGVPVFHSDFRVLVRNEPGFPVVLARSSMHPLGDFAVQRAGANPDLARASARQKSARLTKFSDMEEVIFAGEEERDAVPTLAYKFTAESDDPFSPQGYERHLFVADAMTGVILYEENWVITEDVSGQVQGIATDLVGADICLPENPQGLPYARVNITPGGANVYADANGNFTIPNGGVTPVTVESGVRGRRFIVTDQAAATPILTTNVTPPGPANFLHNAANTNEFTRASVNAYLQANVVRDMVLTYNPAYPTIANQVDFPINTNINTTCNAFYSPLTSINFYRSGGGCANTAFGDVVHHEYGHHVVQTGGSGQGAYGEGMGDCMGVIITDQPALGIGFQNNCSTGIRNANNNCNYQPTGCSSCGSAIHTCGQLISGCVWNTRNELAITNPGTYRDIIGSLTINSVPLHTGTSITPQITIDFLTLDDNDANLNNGTPHYNEIAAGFGSHNMPAPVLPALSFNYPNGRPALVPPNTPYVIDVVVQPLTGTPQPGTGKLFYRIGNSGSFTEVAMTQHAPNEYDATLPATPCPQLIQYYVSAQSTTLQTVTDPFNAPTGVYGATSASSIQNVVAYNFETNPGWTVSSTATDGQWDAAPGIPVNCNRGDPPSDFDGSGRCWLTDNSAANSCNSDVDGGATTLTSQSFDLSTLSSPVVRYARWYSNHTGGAPQADTFNVEVSDNGGGSWSTLEIVGPSTASPNPEVTGGWFLKEFRLADLASFNETTTQFRIRFVASDAGTGSVVEAAIDAFSIDDFGCTVPCGAATGDINGDTFIDGQDVSSFTTALLGSPSPAQICAGDFNTSSALDIGDVDGFVTALLTQP